MYKPDQIREAYKLVNISTLNELSSSTKLPINTIQRLIDLIIYSNMEGPLSNPAIHRVYRLIVKKRLFIRCMKCYGELFRGTKEVLSAREEKQKLKKEEIQPAAKEEETMIISSNVPKEASPG